MKETVTTRELARIGNIPFNRKSVPNQRRFKYILFWEYTITTPPWYHRHHSDQEAIRNAMYSTKDFC